MYQTKAKDFELSKIELLATSIHTSISNSVEILIAIKGSATITENENTLFLEEGQSILIKPTTAYTIQTNSWVEMYKARVPE